MRLVARTRRRIDDPGIHAGYLRIARKFQVACLGYFAQRIALLLLLALPVLHALGVRLGRFLAAILDTAAKLFLFLGLVLRRKRAIVMRDVAAVRRSLQQGHV